METVYNKSIYNHVVKIPDSDDFLIFNFRTRKMMKLNSLQKMVFDTATFDNVDSGLAKRFYEKGIIAAGDEYESLFAEIKHNKENMGELRLVICTTMACNFACKYCFETGVAPKPQMSREIQDSLLHFIEKRIEESKISLVSVYWFGGEPLLAPDVISYLSERIIDICDRRDIQYFGQVYTNGYLLDEKMIRLLEKYRVKAIRISIDGTKEYHDDMRILKNGNGTFDTIMNNLRIPTSIKYRLRCNLTENNKECYDELNEEIKKISLESGNTILLKPDRMRVERDVDKNLKQVEMPYPEYYTLSTEILLKQMHEDFRYFEDLFSSKKVPCTSCNPNGFIIDTMGNLYKCSFYVGDEEHAVGNVLTFDNEGFYTDNKDYKFFLDYVLTEREKCKQCKLLPLCLGRCAYTQMIPGRYDCHRFINSLDDVILALYEAAKKNKEIMNGTI